MIRTQIQLTPSQAAALKRLVAETGLSMAELIRRSVDDLVRKTPSVDRELLRRELRSSFGSFSSRAPTLAREHDAAWAEAATASSAREPDADRG